VLAAAPYYIIRFCEIYLLLDVFLTSKKLNTRK